MTALGIIGTLYLVGIGALVVMALTSPSGWEDDAGFHCGSMGDDTSHDRGSTL